MLTKQEKLSRIALIRKQYEAALYDLVLSKRFAVITDDKQRIEAIEKEAVKIQKVLEEIDKAQKEVEAETE